MTRRPASRVFRRAWPDANSVRPGRSVLLLAAFGMVLIAAGILLATRSYDDRVERIEARLLDAANLTAAVIDDFFESRTALLTATAETVGVMVAAEVAPLLNLDARSQLGIGGGVAWIDAEGFVRSGGSFEPEILASIPPALFRDWRLIAADEPHISAGLEIPPDDRFVLLGVPAAGRRTAGYLIAGIRVEEVMTSLPVSLRAAAELHVVDGAGMLLAEAGRVPSEEPDGIAVPAAVGVVYNDGLRGDSEAVQAVAIATVPGWTVIFERERSSAFGADAARMWGEVGILSALGVVGAFAVLQIRRRMDERHDLLMRRGQELTVLEDLTESLSKAVGAEAVVRAGLEVFDRHFRSDIAIVAVADEAHGSFELSARESAGSILRGTIGFDVPSVFREATAADRPVVGEAESFGLATGPMAAGATDLGLAGVAAIGFESGVTSGSVVLAVTGAFPLPRDDVRLFEAMVRVFGEALGRAAAGDRARHASRVFQDAFRPRDMLGMTSVVQRSHWYVAGTESDDVGGDWYDLVPLLGGRVGLVLGDVVGKGIYAAAVMAQLRGTLRALLESFSTTTEILARVDGLSAQVPGAVGCAITVAVFDPADGRLEVGCAGHLPPLLAVGHEIRALIEARGVPIGVKARARRSATVWLRPGDTLLLYTDGLVERRGESIDTGISRLTDALFLNQARGVHSLTNALLEACRPTSADADDCAVVLLRNSAAADPRRFSVLMPARSESVRELWHDLRAWIEAGGHMGRAGVDLLIVVCAIARGVAGLAGSAEVGVEIEVEDDRLAGGVFARDLRHTSALWAQFGRWTDRIVDGSEVAAELEQSPSGLVAHLAISL